MTKLTLKQNFTDLAKLLVFTQAIGFVGGIGEGGRAWNETAASGVSAHDGQFGGAFIDKLHANRDAMSVTDKIITFLFIPGRELGAKATFVTMDLAKGPAPAQTPTAP